MLLCIFSFHCSANIQIEGTNFSDILSINAHRKEDSQALFISLDSIDINSCSFFTSSRVGKRLSSNHFYSEFQPYKQLILTNSNFDVKLGNKFTTLETASYTSTQNFTNTDFAAHTFLELQNGIFFLINCQFTGITAEKSRIWAQTSVSAINLYECTFDSCEATLKGSAMYCSTTNFKLYKCIFQNISPSSDTSHICHFSSTLTTEKIIEECTFYKIKSTGDCGIHFYFASAKMITYQNCVFNDISAGRKGGAIHAIPPTDRSGSVFKVIGCNFTQISSVSSGGALNILEFQTTYIENCRFDTISMSTSGCSGCCINMEESNNEYLTIIGCYFNPKTTYSTKSGSIHAKDWNSGGTPRTTLTKTIISNCEFRDTITSYQTEIKSCHLYTSSIEFTGNKFYETTKYNNAQFVYIESLSTNFIINNCEFNNIKAINSLYITPLSSMTSLTGEISNCKMNNCEYSEGFFPSSMFLILTKITLTKITLDNCIFNDVCLSMKKNTNTINFDSVFLTGCTFSKTFTVADYSTITLNTFIVKNCYVSYSTSSPFFGSTNTKSISMNHCQFISLHKTTNNFQNVINVYPRTSFSVDNCTFQDIESNSDGVAIYHHQVGQQSALTVVFSIVNSHFENLYSVGEGCIHSRIAYGRFNFENNEFINCTSTVSGGALMQYGGVGTYTTTSCTFNKCRCLNGDGGAICGGAESNTHTFSYCTFIDCESSSRGGAFGGLSQDTFFYYSYFSRTKSSTSGGCIGLVTGTYSLSLTCQHCIFESSESSDGCAIYVGNTASLVTIQPLLNCTFRNYETGKNVCSFQVNSGNHNQFESCLFNNIFFNTFSGCGIWFSSGESDSFLNCIFNNIKSGEQGGVYYCQRTSNFEHCSFSNITGGYNSNDKIGGGVICFSGGNSNSLTVNHCQFNNCTSISNSDSSGGSIYIRSSSSVIISNCEFLNSRSNSQGGCLCFDNYTTIYTSTLTNLTFEKCSSKYGGAISSMKDLILNLQNCSFSSCSSINDGGSIYCYGTIINFRGFSIVQISNFIENIFGLWFSIEHYFF